MHMFYVKKIILDRKCFVHSMYSIILSNESLKFPIKMRTHIFIYNVLNFISTSRKSSQEKKVTIILIILMVMIVDGACGESPPPPGSLR